MEVTRKPSKRRIFQERTNSPTIVLYPLSLPAVVCGQEPDPVDTPPPSTMFVPPPVASKPHSPAKEGDATRRLERYSKAEKALAETWHRCQNETPLYKLQVEALQRAASILNAHVADAKERVEKLRALLADRAMEPDRYQSIQRQRWMEERRRIAAEQLSKVLQQNVSSVPQISTQTHSSGSSNAKADINLVGFFESPRQRAPLRNRTRRRAPRKDKTVDRQEFSRIHHHSHLLPLLLSSSRRRPFEGIKSRTTAAKLPEPLTVSTPLASAASDKPQLAPISEVPPSANPPSPRLPTDTNGTAIIWRDSVRQREDITADLVVAMPDYVVDLLAGFDSTVDSSSALETLPEIPNRTPTSSRTTFKVDNQPLLKTQKAPGSPPRLHKSPSRRRISALFSLPEALSSRLGTRNTGRPKRFSTPPPQTIFEAPPARPFAVSFSSLSSSSADLVSQEPPDLDGKVISRLRRRMSALRLH